MAVDPIRMTTPVDKFNGYVKSERAFGLVSVLFGLIAVYRGVKLISFANNLKLKVDGQSK
jgi:hypothetical protein